MRIGRFQPDCLKGGSPIELETNNDLEKAPIGALVQKWGWLMQVDDDIVRPSTLESWQRRGDDKADAVIEFLTATHGTLAGQDALQLILDYVKKYPTEVRHQSINVFWDHVIQLPPKSVQAQRSDEQGNPILTPQAAIQRCNRAPPAYLDEGMAVYWRHSISLGQGLMYFSLAAGFSAPRLDLTLRETGYLTSPSRDVIYRRLLETLQFVLDVMRDMRPVEGIGWKSAIRVRLLHALARRRISRADGRLKRFDVKVHGIPINQEDLAATLAGFAVAPLWACRRFHAGISMEEETAYVACWRHIGFYMGIDSFILERYFGRGISAAEKFLAASAFHLFATPEEAPSSLGTTDPFESTTMKVLGALADRPPQASSLLHHVDLARRALGPGLSARVGLPKVPFLTHANVAYKLTLIRAFNLFGRCYPRRAWDVDRAQLMQSIIVFLVSMQLDRRRTKFVHKYDEDYTKSYDENGDGEASDVALDRKAGVQIRRRYAALLREMFAILVGCVILGAVLMRLCYRTSLHILLYLRRASDG